MMATNQFENSGHYVQKNSLNTLKNYKEIGDLALWTLSSAKQGNGIFQLRDSNAETFWQSDGPIPHLITIQFQQKVKISNIAIYLDLKTDESYTPEVISIRGGLNVQSMHEIRHLQLDNPNNWVIVPLSTNMPDGITKPYIYTMNLQIAVIQMFHSGKDTHVRQVKLFGYEDSNAVTGKDEVSTTSFFDDFTLR